MAAVSSFPALRWRFLAATCCLRHLLAAEYLWLADKLGDKSGESTANYNIPLWEEGKVPLAQRQRAAWTTRSSPSSCPRKASGTAVP